MMYLVLAWRNIWRNRRRSFISIASVLLAVIVAVLMRSFQLGFYSNAINNFVSYYSGYLQVQAPGYWQSRSLDDTFVMTDSLENTIIEMHGLTLTSPRLETYALIAAAAATNGAMIIGVDPDRENQMTSLGTKVQSGRYLHQNDDGILLASGLAAQLSVSIGDTVVILGQGYHGVTAAGKYAVAGLLEFPSPNMNNSFAYLSLTEAQNLTDAPNRLTSLAIMIDKQRHLESTAAALRRSLGDNYVVMTWKQITPELVQLIQTDSAGGLIMLFVVYLVIGFGILGTVLMMTVERTREFGVLMAIGMKKFRLGLVVTIESVMLSFIGVILGAIATVPVVLYFYYHPLTLAGAAAEATVAFGFEPIMPVSLDPMILV